jgi:cell division protein FtsL
MYDKKILATEERISRLEAHILVVKKDIRKLTLQIDLAIGKERLLEKAHAADIAARKVRAARQAEMLKAVHYIVD